MESEEGSACRAHLEVRDADSILAGKREWDEKNTWADEGIDGGMLKLVLMNRV
jgi:hypothetical protein